MLTDFMHQCSVNNDDSTDSEAESENRQANDFIILVWKFQNSLFGFNTHSIHKKKDWVDYYSTPIHLPGFLETDCLLLCWFAE